MTSTTDIEAMMLSIDLANTKNWVGEDWDDSAETLKPIENENRRLMMLHLNPRDPQTDNRKRKLCYTYQVDDGYGCSKAFMRRFRRTGRRHICGRGKRLKSDQEDEMDDSTQKYSSENSLSENSEEMQIELTDTLDSMNRILKIID